MSTTFNHRAVANHRATMRYSQAELANRAGISRATLQNTEAGVSIPRADVIGRIADALGVDVGALFIHDPEADTASTGCGKPTGGAAAARRSPAGATEKG